MIPKSDPPLKGSVAARIEEIKNQGLFFSHPVPHVPVPEPTGGIDGMNGCLVGILLGLSIR